MGNYTFTYLKEYMEAKGIEVKKIPGGYLCKNHKFYSIKDLRDHILRNY